MGKDPLEDVRDAVNDADDTIDDAVPDTDPVSDIAGVPCDIVEETVRGAWGTKLPRDVAAFVLERLEDPDFVGRLREAGGEETVERLRAEEAQLRRASEKLNLQGRDMDVRKDMR